MRDGHLKNADFLDVERYPEIVFALKKITKISGDTFQVTGDLTIKDVTKEITLGYEHNGSAVDPYGNVKVGGTLTGTINRNDWGPRLERSPRRRRTARRREGEARDRR